MRKFEKISYPEFVKVFGDNKTLYDDYMLPLRGTKCSAGYDFFAIKDYVIKPNEIVKIPTGYKATFESDYYNNRDNEGHMWVCLQNHGDKEYIINKGDAYAQGIFVKFLTTDDDNVKTLRTGGIGSTNKKKEGKENE